MLRERFDKENLALKSMRTKNYTELLTELDSGEI